MALDPITRRELRRLRDGLGLALGLASNPIAVLTWWFLQPAAARRRRRVHVSANGHVTRVEALPPSGRGG